MSNKHRDVVVIGTSAGGLEAMDELIGQLPTDLPASIFVVQHMAPENTGAALVQRLQKHRAFGCALATDGEEIVAGRVYIGPPDHHMLLRKDSVSVTKGARENRYRPGIDPLFRSAATAHSSRVIAVLLTGMLDDGTAGMSAVKKCGGVTVVQDPKHAAYPDMALNALNNVEVDYCVPLSEMGELLETLVSETARKSPSVPKDVRTEAEIAERVLSDVAQVSALGSQVPYNCPNCGGVLWQLKASAIERYRCHTGHSFTSAALLTSQNEKIEETLWVAMRMFEERKNLLNSMAKGRASSSHMKHSYAEQANASQVHIDRIRMMLSANPPRVDDPDPSKGGSSS